MIPATVSARSPVVIGIDPGPTACGLAVYRDGRVVYADKAASIDAVLDYLRNLRTVSSRALYIGIERVQSYGISGGSLLQTSEVVGRLQQRALDLGLPVSLHYRRDVLRFLDVTGRGNRDSLVRLRLIEMHGGTREAAIGLKASPGPLYGVSGHAWQALAVALCARDAL